MRPLIPNPNRLTTDTREPYAHCVCVVGKNYRLQNIQLSKILRDFRFKNSEFRLAGRRLQSETLNLKSRRKHGGEYRARTGDLLVANQALSQLS